MTNDTNKNRFWSSDKGILVICLGISVVFWIFVKFSKTYSTEITVPIQYNIPLDRAFSFSPPNNLQAKIKGDGWDLFFVSISKISPIQITVNPDLKSQTISHRDLVKKINSNFSSKNVLIEDVNFDNILIQTDRLEKTVVPIVLKSDIHFSKGNWYGNEGIQLSQDSVTIVGPASEINHLEYWNTEILSVEDLDSDFKTKVHLETPIDKTVQLNPTIIDATIFVEEQTAKSFFIPIEYINNSDSIHIFPSKVKVTATIGISKFDQLKPSDYAIVIDFKKIKNNGKQNTIPVTLSRKPDYVRNIHFNPTSIEYFIVQKENGE